MTVLTLPREIIDTLRKLQSIDDEIREVRQARDEMIGNLDRLQRVLSHLDRELSDKREKLAEAETWHTKKSGELEIERDKLLRSKAKLSGVNKSREYVAVNRELDSVRRNIAQREDEVGRLNAAIEEFRATIDAEDHKVSDLRVQATEASASNADELASMNAAIEVVEVRRRQIEEGLERRLVRRYAKISEARDGRAVSPVIDATCTGCNMVLQPRFVEILLRCSSLVQCPHCNRFLFMETTHDADGNVVPQ